MDIARIVDSAPTHFERLLRWVYPGLLVWLVLPLSATSGPFNIARYTGFYGGLPVWGHLSLFLVAGFVAYMFER